MFGIGLKTAGKIAGVTLGLMYAGRFASDSLPNSVQNILGV